MDCQCNKRGNFETREAKHSSGSNTYSSKSNNLTRELSTSILRNTVEVKDKLRERFAVMPLPLSNGVHSVRRRLLAPRRLQLRRPILLTSSNQLLFKRARIGVVGPSREELRLRAVVGRRPVSGGRPSILLRRVHHLLFGRRLAVGNFELSRSSSFGRQEPCPMRRIGCIRHVGERASSRHVQGGLGRRWDEYSGHGSLSLKVERVVRGQ